MYMQENHMISIFTFDKTKIIKSTILRHYSE